MVLPFVREFLADLEHSEAFERVRRHMSGGTGRRRVSGLTATARALYLPFFVRAANAPCVIIVSDNKAAESLHAGVLAACELTGALSPDSVLRLPAHDVLPFENLSPHPEIQESRAATLWKIATGTARLVIAPVEAACMRLFPRDYYSALALRLRVGGVHARHAGRAPALGRLHPRGRGRDAGAGDHPRRDHRRLLPGDGSPRPHRLLRGRDRVDPQVRPRDAAQQLCAG